MSINIKTELISEIYKSCKMENSVDQNIEILTKKHYSNGISKEQFKVNKKVNHQDIGLYTIFNSKHLLIDPNNQINMIHKLANTLKCYIKQYSTSNVLVVGLGNRHISADSLGAKVIRNIIVTRHLHQIKTLNSVSAIVPGVLGITGIETFDIVKAVISKTSPTLVIAIDSLCASSYKNLGTSFQINNASLTPGGGVNNPREKLCAETLNTSFISIGVPLVIYANTFADNPKKKLNNLVVTLKDIEEVSHICAKIISYAINMAIHNLTIEEVKDYLNKI